MATNVVAPIALTREMLPLLRAAFTRSRSEYWLNAGRYRFPLFAAYSASKFGLRGLSNALRRELKGLGIGVTYAAPRGALTDATRAIMQFVEPFDMPLDSAETIAREVWDAVVQGKDSVYPRGRERLFVLIERLFPSIVNRAVASQLKTNCLQKMIEESAPAPGPVMTLRHITRIGSA